jgi:polysaccharide deacetylase family protein (PEP-CTERM system associated)
MRPVHGSWAFFRDATPPAKRLPAQKMKSPDRHFLFTVDVEDWFQVENFKPWIPFSSWDSFELRVERNVQRLLDLLDDAPRPSASFTGPAGRTSSTSGQSPICQAASQKLRATFFVLGWVARRLPQLMREIQARGHEVASHGDNHGLPTQMRPEDFRKDLVDSRKRLEDIIGGPVTGFRAPSFNINDHVLSIIAEAGFGYDASYNSFDLHGRYGRISLRAAEKIGGSYRIADRFFEVPISNLRAGGRVLPWGGGAYFRLLPLFLFKAGVRQILASEGVYVFYLHPWEIDPGQPRVGRARFQLKFRHYTNLRKTDFRLEKLLADFSHCRFMSCRDYIKMTANDVLQRAPHSAALHLTSGAAVQ